MSRNDSNRNSRRTADEMALLAAAFDVTESIEPAFATRVKMNQSSNVIAVAMMADGKVLFAQKEVKVTLGGCGG